MDDRLGVVEELPVPPPPLESHLGCGPKVFPSPSGRFTLYYDDSDARFLPTVDTASTFTDLTGATVTLTAGGGHYGPTNAPDTVELTAALLDSAYAVMAADFTLRTGSNRYEVRLEDPPLAGLTGARGYVDPTNGVAMVSPSRLPWLTISDLRTWPTTVAVHEFVHQVQFDYGWNLGRFLDQADGDGDGVGDACDGDSKPDLVVTYGGIPPAGAGFEIKNVGTAVARGPVHYEVSAYQNAGGFRTFRRTTLELALPQGGLAPGRRASTEIPQHVLDPAQRTSYDDVQVYIDSELAVDELDESNNRRAIH